MIAFCSMSVYGFDRSVLSRNISTMHLIATRHLAWVRAYLKSKSGAKVFIEARERLFAILWEESRTVLKYKDFKSLCYRKY